MEFKLNEYHRNVSDEELLKDILRVAKSLNKDTITIKEYVDNGGKYHSSTISRRFNGWINAIQMAGLTPPQSQINKSGVSEEDLIEDLKSVANKLKKQTFTTTEYSYYGKYSKEIAFRKFKTWNNALLAAGLEPFDHPLGGTKNKISEYACFEEIERIWIELGRQPTSTDIKNGVSRYSLHAYERRFGTWRKSLEAFVKYINSEYEIEITDEKENEENNTISINYQQPSNKPVHKTKRDINLRLRFKVMQRDNFKCCICGASPAKDPSVVLHIDHIIPWSKGGETTIDNLQTLCSKCNLGKSDLL